MCVVTEKTMAFRPLSAAANLTQILYGMHLEYMIVLAATGIIPVSEDLRIISLTVRFTPLALQRLDHLTARRE